ncbi:MAG: thiamine phosphate synthase [Candidatus Dormibacteraeota bacterium]|nr:thiamine phosphate synthase [Candidatus Dormibacteraeota bacterium]
MREDRARKLAAARLYAITPSVEPAAVQALVGAWLRGGVDLIQLRHKRLRRDILLELARSLASRCAEAQVLFLVNDQVDIALLCGADGVHVGEEDLSLPATRRLVGSELVVGASAGASRTVAAAEAEGADYVGCGPAFPTAEKPLKPVLGPAAIARISSETQLPVFAVGGITLDRLGELKALGLRRVSVIAGLSQAAESEQAARAFREALADG